MAKNSVYAIPLQHVDSALFGVGGYSELSPLNGLGFACFYMRIFNHSNKDIYISYDGGVTNHDILAAGAVKEIYTQNQSQPNNYVCKFPANFVVWVDSVDNLAGVGLVYLSAYYQPN